LKNRQVFNQIIFKCGLVVALAFAASEHIENQSISFEMSTSLSIPSDSNV
jgi:hypothetical protein